MLEILYQGDYVRAPYIALIQSVVSKEFDVTRMYTFFDGSIKRDGVAYLLGNQEVYWLKQTMHQPELLIIRSQTLRESILDLLAVHPLYAKWFDH